MNKELMGVDYYKKSECNKCQEKEADCWVSNHNTHNEKFYMCIDCYIRRSKNN